MQTVIVGAGAMGSLVGALLTENGIDVTLYDIAREQVAAIREQGLIIERGDRKRTVRIPATCALKEIEFADLLILLVKSYDTRNAVRGVMPLISSRTLVLTLQNGGGNLEMITELIPKGQVFAGVTSHGAMRLGLGVIRHNGGAKTYLGPADDKQLRKAEEIAGLLNQGGLETMVSRDIQGTIWTKLTANAAINPLTAITGCTNGELLEHQDTIKIMEMIIEEVKKTASAQGIQLLHEDMFDYVKSVCAATRENKSSMLMDILGGRRTEIDAMNGLIALLGKKYGVPVPVNKCMSNLVRVIESNSVRNRK